MDGKPLVIEFERFKRLVQFLQFLGIRLDLFVDAISRDFFWKFG